METKLINLVGASGSGKTTIARELEKAGCNIIQSYTTRPPRYKGEWGHTFLSGELVIGEIFNGRVSGLDYYKDETIQTVNNSICEIDTIKIPVLIDNIIAYFNSYNSGHHYFATDEQVVRGKTNIYIVDNKGAEQVHEFYKDNHDIEVITVYLQADEKERENRLLERAIGDLDLSEIAKDKSSNEYKETREKILEVEDRLIEDFHIFKTIKCDYVIDGNQSIEEVVKMMEGLI